MDHSKRDEHAARSKSLEYAYGFWFVLSPLGVHRLYLGKLNGLIQPALFFLGPFLESSVGALAGLGVASLTCGGLWVIADAFLIPGMVREYNAALADSPKRSEK